MKCGTTSLHSYLGQHPEIFTSKIKEINFFNKEKNFQKGTESYKENFCTSKKLKGEASQSYTRGHWFKDTPKRIHSVIPDVKLIYIVRDPVERIVSHYYESVSQGYDIPKDFVNYIIQNPDNNWVKTSSYYWQLEKYFSYFKKSQFLIITSEGLKNDRLNTLNKVFDFLEVKSINNVSLFENALNKRTEKKVHTGVFKALYNEKLNKIIPATLKKRIMDSVMGRKVLFNDIKKITFTEQEKSKLRELLKTDVEKLKKFTGYEFEDWYF